MRIFSFNYLHKTCVVVIDRHRIDISLGISFYLIYLLKDLRGNTLYISIISIYSYQSFQIDMMVDDGTKGFSYGKINHSLLTLQWLR